MEDREIKCRVCHKKKDRSEFSEANLKVYNRICLLCMRQKTIEHERTPRGLLLAAYNKFRHTAKRFDLKVHFTRAEFMEWGDRHKELKKLYTVWSGFEYKKILRPSFCRINPKTGFHLDNMTVMPLREMHINLGLSRSRKVLQYDLEGNYLATYPNASVAARDVNGSPGTLSTCARGYRVTHKGYKWSFCD